MMNKDDVMFAVVGIIVARLLKSKAKSIFIYFIYYLIVYTRYKLQHIVKHSAVIYAVVLLSSRNSNTQTGHNVDVHAENCDFGTMRYGTIPTDL